MKYNAKYVQGIAWFLLSIIVSNANDVIVKFMSDSMHFMQISFFRFAFGTLSLLPFMLYFGRSAFATSRPIVHMARGAILFFAMSMWIYGLGLVPIASATLITFTIPVFVLIMAPLFLREKVGSMLWVATILGLLGVVIVFNPSSADFNPLALFMLLSAIMFASLDIINKKFVIKESMLSMLFYSALTTTVLSAYPAYLLWKTPELRDIGLLIALGIGSNFVLYCLLKAFAIVNASAVAPYRYLELVISGITGYILFSETPGMNMLLGAAIIIPATLYIAYAQIKPAS